MPQRRVAGQQLVQFALLGAGLGFGGPDVGDQAGHDRDEGVAARGAHALLDVAVIGLRGGQVVGHRVDGFGAPRRQVAALIRAAGLEQHRMALRGAGHRQGAVHQEMVALVMDLVQAVGDAIETGAINGQRVVFPGIEQPQRDVDEFLGAGVAPVVVRHGFVAVVARLGVEH
ncbi:hypothetical protein D3C72_1650320 [compost metagenome]